MNKINNPEWHPKVWGSEYWIVNSSYCGKILRINRKYRCSIHYHKNKEETFYVLQGIIFMEVNDQKMFLLPGDQVDISPGTKHRFTGFGTTNEIIEFSTHHEEDDSYREVESGIVGDEEWLKIKKLYSQF